VKPPDKTTEELARDIKRGFTVEENFRQLFERRYPQIRRFFQRKGFSPEDSYELTQETFLSVYKGLKDFRQESSFDNWMFSIAENIWRSELERRKARKRDAPLVSLDQEIASETDDFSPLAARIADRSPDQLDRLCQLWLRSASPRFRQCRMNEAILPGDNHPGSPQTEKTPVHRTNKRGPASDRRASAAPVPALAAQDISNRRSADCGTAEDEFV
jgi:RNA polymerase sigma factor (sigma-70 family)